MSESADHPEKLRVRAGLAFVQVLRPALYALLALSALLTFWSGGDIAGKALPQWTRIVGPTLFATFLVVFAIYRYALVRAKKYPAAIGFFQVGLGALIWVMLLPSTRQKFSSPEGEDEVRVLMSSPDARVRALAAELAGFRGKAGYAGQLIDRLDDPDTAVRARAHAALVRLAGADLGATPEAWRAFAREHGWL